jgi:hypothetical protein
MTRPALALVLWIPAAAASAALSIAPRDRSGTCRRGTPPPGMARRSAPTPRPLGSETWSSSPCRLPRSTQPSPTPVRFARGYCGLRQRPEAGPHGAGGLVRRLGRGAGRAPGARRPSRCGHPAFASAIAAPPLAYDADLPPTVFLCAEDPAAKETVAGLVRDLGGHPVDAGPLTAARYLEPAMMLLISLAYAGAPRDLGLRCGYINAARGAGRAAQPRRRRRWGRTRVRARDSSHRQRRQARGARTALGRAALIEFPRAVQIALCAATSYRGRRSGRRHYT